MKKIFFGTAFLLLLMFCIVSLNNAPFYLIWKIIFDALLLIGFMFFVVSCFLNGKLLKLSIYCEVFIIAIVLLFLVLYKTGFLSHFSSLEDARLYFQSFGKLTSIIFFIIQLLQVVILPIPAQITTIAGVLIFGPFKSFIISSFATVIGSIICFLIGRKLGVKVLNKLANQETIEKYRDLLTTKGKILLPVIFLFPCFPDDLICYIAGTTKMTLKYFTIITILTRIIGIASICYFGSGDIIPFHGTGLIIWAGIGVVMVLTFVLLLKYQEKIEKFIINLFTKKSRA